MSMLNIELYGDLLGRLIKKDRDFDFIVNEEIFEKYPISSTIMSLGTPLNQHFSAVQKRRYRNFFSELLPEGRNMRWITQALLPEERDTYGILRKYGKDIAGALVIYDPEDDSAKKRPRAEKVDSKKIRHLLEHMPQEPFANSPVSGKTSLGGVQGKIVLRKKGSLWYRTHYGFPSTHILKPVVPEYPTMIYDEAFCMQLAHKLNLTKYPVWIENFSGLDALVIERYDRDKTVINGRIHQEDFNQVLGAHSDEKYQEYGGKVSAKRVAETLDRVCGTDGVSQFAKQLIFAIVIGNLDMHTKNISIFHYPDQSVRLAPTYDQVPLRHQGTDGRMALAVGGEYIHANITINKIISELISWKTQCFRDKKEAESFILGFVSNCNNNLNTISLSKKAHPSLKKEIGSFIENLIAGKRIGL